MSLKRLPGTYFQGEPSERLKHAGIGMTRDIYGTAIPSGLSKYVNDLSGHASPPMA